MGKIHDCYLQDKMIRLFSYFETNLLTNPVADMAGFENFIVNYVWMQFDKESPPRPIPSHLFYNVQQNAKIYPRTEFRVWVEDPATVGPYRVPVNVKICLLQDIKSLSAVPVMRSKNKSDGWAKVDTARLLVIQYVLGSEERPVVYSDFDVPKVFYGPDRIKSRLNNYGVALGGTYNLVGKKRWIATEYENGYSAYTAKARDLLHCLIKSAKSCRGGGRNSVYNSQADIISQWAAGKKIADWSRVIASLPMLPPCGWRDTSLRAELR